MGVAYIRENSLSVKDKNKYTLNSFKGVDFSQTMIGCSSERSIDACNFIIRNGINQKRYGVKQFFGVGEGSGNIGTIHNVWDYINEDNERTIVIYMGASGNTSSALFKINNPESFCNGEIYAVDSKSVTKIEGTSVIEALDETLYGIVQNKRLYILTGYSFVVYGKFDGEYQLKKVSEIAYTPTTTVGIGSTGSATDNRMSYEDVNMLTPYRINTMIAEEVYQSYLQEIKVGTDLTNKYIVIDYKNIDFTKTVDAETGIMNFDGLSTPVFNLSDGTLKMSNGTTNYGTPNYKADGIDYYESIVGITNSMILQATGPSGMGTPTNYKVTGLNDADIRKDGTKPIFYYYDGEKTYDYALDSTIDIDSDIEFAIKNAKNISYDVSIDEDRIFVMVNSAYHLIGYIYRDLGLIRLYFNSPSYNNVEPNMSIKFKHKNSENENKINKCRFGIMFGYGGDRNNLFLSGNPDYPNYDFCSDDNNLTYFFDTSYKALGTTAIIGYQLINDGVLAIYKEESSQEPTIYYRTASTQSATNDNGSELNYVEEIFPVQIGNIGETPINRYCIDYLRGDNLILSKNGVFGISLVNNLSTEQRYSFERSKLINPKLLKEKNLKNAVSIVYKGKYYLAVDNHVYVCDSAYTYKADDDSDTYQYEWWYWEMSSFSLAGQAIVFNIKQWFIINDKLCFSANAVSDEASVGGMLFVFDEKHSDRFFQGTSSGTNVFYNSTNQFISAIPLGAPLDETGTTLMSVFDGITILEKDKFYQYFTDSKMLTFQNDHFVISEGLYAEHFMYLEGTTIYVSTEKGTDGYRMHEYTIRDVTPTSFKISSSWSGEYVTLTNGEHLVLKKISDYETLTAGDDMMSFRLLCEYNGNTSKKIFACDETKDDVINLDNIVNTATSTIYFHIKMPIKAYWNTPALNFGTDIYTKNIRGITTTCEGVTGGTLQFGIKTKDKSKEIKVEGINSIDFSDVNFKTFTFETSDFAKSFQKNCKIRGANFYQMWWISDDDKNCAVHQISIIYTIGKRIRGVK